MVANATELIEANGAVRGVRYVAEDGRHEVQALLTGKSYLIRVPVQICVTFS
jgi:hypothetical protein